MNDPDGTSRVVGEKRSVIGERRFPLSDAEVTAGVSGSATEPDPRTIAGPADEQGREGDAEEPPPWGPWATVGWTSLAMLAFLIVSFVVGIIAAVAMIVTGQLDPQRLDLGELAWLELAAYLLAGPAALGLLLLAVKQRRWSFRRYIGLRRCSASAIYVALAVGTAYLAVQMSVTYVLDRPAPEFMDHAFAVRLAWPLVFVTLVLAAPLVEEIIFRGFMYRGLAASRLGPAIAVLITSLTWTVIHVQYGWYELGWIFVLGIVLGITRHVTGSIWPAIAIHVQVNLVATILMMIYMMA